MAFLTTFRTSDVRWGRVFYFLPRLQERGLLVVIVLLGLVLTFAADPIMVQGRTVNNFLRLDKRELVLP